MRKYLLFSALKWNIYYKVLQLYLSIILALCVNISLFASRDADSSNKKFQCYSGNTLL